MYCQNCYNTAMIVQYAVYMTTVEPPNKGHFGANGSVPRREVVPILEVKIIH